MPHEITLITTIAGCFILALVFGFIAAKLKFPTIIGYLIAGIIAGPATPGFVADAELSGQLSEIGIILLMFGVGLHFSLNDLLSVRKIALPGAIVQIAVATLMGMTLAKTWGWSYGEGFVFGITLSTASTVVLLKALEERGLLETINGRIAVGWLIVEDLAMVLVLVILPPLSGWLGGYSAPVQSSESIWVTLGITFGKVSVFIFLMIFLGRRIFPWLLWKVAQTGSRELFTLCVITAAVGIAYVSSVLFGVSFALGAFFAGMVLQESDLSFRAAEESLPLRDAFAVLFFVSVGMLFQPEIVIQKPLQVISVVLIIIFGKSVAAFLLVLLFRYPLNTALTVSASLAQIGEFSFILAVLGASLNLLSIEGHSLILSGSIISISLNSLLFKTIEPIQKWVRTKSNLANLLERSDDPLAELPMSFTPAHLTGHIVLVGYGRVGKRIGERLIQSNIRFVAADENRDIVESLRSRGLPAVFGDSSEPSVLIQAHIVRAKTLVVAIPDTFKIRKILEIAKTLNPTIEIIYRIQTEEEAELLKKETHGKIFIEEAELADSMFEYIEQKYSVKKK
ncbi:MAG: Kef family K(+) transporter [Leptospiraceae bacterium]|nr:Kef family K(+) transporter [Leptospiraceae bacterium]MCK6379933.1 Kef family K(+) transporter [Leptospiraceae bacterium]